MRYEREERDGLVVAALVGDVDLESSGEMRRALIAEAGRARALVVDLGAVTLIDSSGVASLVEAYQSCRHRGVPFALAAPSPQVVRVLRLARLDEVFPVHDSRDAACRAVAGGR